MGPTIILDKCVIQSLSQLAIYELNRYFCTNITPVLLMEILADLSLHTENPHRSAESVQIIAHKVCPANAFPNIHYKTLCVNNLFGFPVEMTRHPVVGGVQQVTSDDGNIGDYLGITPENEVIMRWQQGFFIESDVIFAKNWRDRIEGINLEEKNKFISKMWDRKFKSLVELKQVIDAAMSDHNLQLFFLNWFMDVLCLEPVYRQLIQNRWDHGEHKSFLTFAPYALHCARIHVLFHVGIANHLLSTRSSNLLDIEYLCYTPFCNIFSSSDKFLKQLAPLVLETDQSFVDGNDLRLELEQIGALRRGTRDSTSLGSIEPDEKSIIQSLWKKHRGYFVQHQPITPERSAKIMEQLKPIMNAADKVAQNRPSNPHWPLNIQYKTIT
ncbi:MAG TPA: hypothetical protein VMG59_06245 [Phycisphaerae bacterium]|nr:hypothetical protein [Phycisphaerae bacterium]